MHQVGRVRRSGAVSAASRARCRPPPGRPGTSGWRRRVSVKRRSRVGLVGPARTPGPAADIGGVEAQPGSIVVEHRRRVEPAAACVQADGQRTLGTRLTSSSVKRQRRVVHRLVAEILERAQDGQAPAGAGQPADQDDPARRSSEGARHLGPPVTEVRSPTPATTRCGADADAAGSTCGPGAGPGPLVACSAGCGRRSPKHRADTASRTGVPTRHSSSRNQAKARAPPAAPASAAGARGDRHPATVHPVVGDQRRTHGRAAAAAGPTCRSPAVRRAATRHARRGRRSLRGVASSPLM